MEEEDEEDEEDEVEDDEEDEDEATFSILVGFYSSPPLLREFTAWSQHGPISSRMFVTLGLNQGCRGRGV